MERAYELNYELLHCTYIDDMFAVSHDRCLYKVEVGLVGIFNRLY